MPKPSQSSPLHNDWNFGIRQNNACYQIHCLLHSQSLFSMKPILARQHYQKYEWGQRIRSGNIFKNNSILNGGSLAYSNVQNLYISVNRIRKMKCK